MLLHSLCRLVRRHQMQLVWFGSFESSCWAMWISLYSGCSFHSLCWSARHNKCSWYELDLSNLAVERRGYPCTADVASLSVQISSTTQMSMNWSFKTSEWKEKGNILCTCSTLEDNSIMIHGVDLKRIDYVYEGPDVWQCVDILEYVCPCMHTYISLNVCIYAF